MRRRIAFCLLVAVVIVTPAAAEDGRTPIEMPPEARSAFLEHMRHHMDSLDDVMAQLAVADFRGAAKAAREQLVPGSGAGFGRYLPVEFREMGLAMHRAAADFAEVGCSSGSALSGGLEEGNRGAPNDFLPVPCLPLCV